MAVTLANNHRNGAVASVGVAHVHVVATSKILCSQKKTHTHTHRIRAKEMRIRQRCAQFCTVFNGVEVWEREKEWERRGVFVSVWGVRRVRISMRAFLHVWVWVWVCWSVEAAHGKCFKKPFQRFFSLFFWRGVNIERAGSYKQFTPSPLLMLPQKRGRIIKHLNDFKRNYVGTST